MGWFGGNHAVKLKNFSVPIIKGHIFRGKFNYSAFINLVKKMREQLTTQ
jgi:hypothetical protein